MPVLNEPTWTSEAIVSEGNGTISRENVTILSGQNLKACAALGKITASGKYVALAPGASDGSQTFAGILLDDCDATGGDKKAPAILRLAELNRSEIGWNTMNAGQIDAAVGQAVALNILIRSAI